MSNKKKIKLGVFPNHKKIKGSLQPKYQVPHDLSLVLDIWSDINRKLKDKYEIEMIWMKNDNYDDAINDIYNNKYDGIIGAFVPTEKRRKKVNFSDVYLMSSPIIVYSPENKRTQFMKYIKYLFSIWYIPITILIIFSFLFGIIEYLVKQKSPVKGSISLMTSIYYVLAGFLGQSGGILSVTKLNDYKHVMAGIITFVIIYFFGIYISASTTAKSVSYLEKNYKIEYSIENLRILTFPGWMARVVKENKGIPVLLPERKTNIMKFYLENKKKLNLDGYLYLPLNKITDYKKEGLTISNIILKYYRASFPVSKKQKELLADINISIRKLQDNNNLFNLCDLRTNKSYVMC